MVYYNGHTGQELQVAGLEDLIEIGKRVKRDKEYGAIFKMNPTDCAYVIFSTEFYTKKGEPGFCLIWRKGKNWKPLKPFAYENAATALKALYHC